MKEADPVRPEVPGASGQIESGASECSGARSAHLGRSIASAETCSGGGFAETVSAFPET